jgi:PD-(D/E)XK nuclease superfamily
MTTSTNTPIEPVGYTISSAEQRRILNEFLANCKELRTLESKLGGFSLFRVLRFEEGEIRHSNVLGWLLDPSESHGLGDAFLRNFLVRLKNKHPDNTTLPDVIDVEAAKFEVVEVTREWADQKTRDRLDLLAVLKLRGGAIWVLAIEVKIGSQQGKGQLQKYQRKLDENEEYRDARRVYLFLTRDGEKPDGSSDFIDIDFSVILEVLKQCLDERGDLIASGPKYLVEEYMRLLETQIIIDPEIEDLVRQIDRIHGKALTIIFKYRQDLVKAVSARLDKQLSDAVMDLRFKVLKTVKGCVYLLPELWDTPTNNKEGGTVSRRLYCQLDFFYPTKDASLKIMLEDRSGDFRNKIIAVTQDNPLFTRGKQGRPGQNWTSLYSENLHIKIDKFDNDETPNAEEEATTQLIRKTKDAIESQDMKNRITTLSSVLSV